MKRLKQEGKLKQIVAESIDFLGRFAEILRAPHLDILVRYFRRTIALHAEPLAHVCVEFDPVRNQCPWIAQDNGVGQRRAMTPDPMRDLVARIGCGPRTVPGLASKVILALKP